MDQVTHFLFLTALVLFIVMLLMWFIGGSCAAGAVAGTSTASNVKGEFNLFSSLYDFIKRFRTANASIKNIEGNIQRAGNEFRHVGEKM